VDTGGLPGMSKPVSLGLASRADHPIPVAFLPLPGQQVAFRGPAIST